MNWFLRICKYLLLLFLWAVFTIFVQIPFRSTATLRSKTTLEKESSSSLRENSRIEKPTLQTSCLPELDFQDSLEFEEWEENYDLLNRTNFEKAWSALDGHSYIRFLLSNNTVYYQLSQGGITINEAVAFMLLKTVVWAHDQGNPLPDMELIVNHGDRCASKRNQGSLPIWSWSIAQADCNDFFMPYWSFLWRPRLLDNSKSSLLPWESRIPKLIFRGTNTGHTTNLSINMYETWMPGKWRESPRAIISTMCREKLQDLCDAGFHRIMGSEALKQEMKHLIKEPINATEEKKYRYQMMIDGNGPPSSRSLRLFSTGSTVFKAESPATEFWYPMLRPYVNYIPVARNLDNLEDSLLWSRKFEDQAKRIADNGLKMVEYMTDERVTCWFASKLRHYAGLMGKNGDNVPHGPLPKMKRLTLEAAKRDYFCNYIVGQGLGTEETCREVMKKVEP